MNSKQEAGTPVPFPNSYWIEPGRLLAGEYPRHFTDEKSAEKLAALLDAGVTCIINLTLEGDRTQQGSLKPYGYIIRELEKERGVTGEPCAIIRMGINDGWIPDGPFMKRILDTIDAHLDANGVVYFHCWGGHGRTGTVAGCWLKRHGKAKGEEVFDIIKNMRRNMKDTWKQSPENEEQKDFVRKWGE